MIWIGSLLMCNTVQYISTNGYFYYAVMQSMHAEASSALQYENM